MLLNGGMLGFFEIIPLLNDNARFLRLAVNRKRSLPRRRGTYPSNLSRCTFIRTSIATPLIDAPGIARKDRRRMRFG
jgi:hypothetical protein